MILYSKDGKKEKINTNNLIGEGFHGKVYKLSNEECIKIFKNSKAVDDEIFQKIKELELKNYYKILNIYYNNLGNFKALKTRYYQKEDIDILTVPTEYTLDNLYRLQNSINKLTKSNIQIEDTHTDNIIIDKNNITIIDVDLYSFNRFYTNKQLEIKNIQKLGYLFKDIFSDSVTKYHSNILKYEIFVLFDEIFQYYSSNQIERTYKKLIKYKYPIDYIKKNL